jgi:hypothetical protein
LIESSIALPISVGTISKFDFPFGKDINYDDDYSLREFHLFGDNDEQCAGRLTALLFVNEA